MAGRRSLVEGLKKVDRRKELAFVKGRPDTAETEEPKPPKAKPERKHKRERAKAAKPKPESKEQWEGEEPTPTPALYDPRPGELDTGRMPLSTRIRTKFGIALKRASLERQLIGHGEAEHRPGYSRRSPGTLAQRQGVSEIDRFTFPLQIVITNVILPSVRYLCVK